jgi:hypothetical protein
MVQKIKFYLVLAFIVITKPFWGEDEHHETEGPES